MAAYVAFALAYRELHGALALHYLVSLPGWIGWPVWLSLAVLLAVIANRRAFQSLARPVIRILCRVTLVGSVAALLFVVGFLASVQFLVLG
jgi:hypothetical protein